MLIRLAILVLFVLLSSITKAKDYDLSSYSEVEEIKHCDFTLYTKPGEYFTENLIINHSTQKHLNLYGKIKFAPKKCYFLQLMKYGDITEFVIYNSKFVEEWHWKRSYNNNIKSNPFDITQATWTQDNKIRLDIHSEKQDGTAYLIRANNKWDFKADKNIPIHNCNDGSKSEYNWNLCDRKKEQLIISQYPNLFYRAQDLLRISFDENNFIEFLDCFNCSDSISLNVLKMYFEQLKLSFICSSYYEWHDCYLIDHIGRKMFTDITAADAVHVSPFDNKFILIVNEIDGYEGDEGTLYILKQTDNGLIKELEFLISENIHKEIINVKWVSKNKLSCELVETDYYKPLNWPDDLHREQAFIEKINGEWRVYTKKMCFLNKYNLSSNRLKLLKSAD